ncbi:hypothetical protein L9F63_010237 [Diploptera punctata]|uniref:ABC1 atypical kinase-like domain-containing protein n=1 Tax=Diploptera punctata TaxID=6984 RepID=A0AAD8AIE0_DIPPU|nr:hypothetical protein L9F63_010237 [Diploptera punctata]
MWIRPIFTRACNFSNICTRIRVHILQQLPHNINSTRLKWMPTKYRTGEFRTSWISSTNQFIPFSCNVVLISAVCSGFQEKVTHVLNPTSEIVDYHRDIASQYQSRGLIHLIRRIIWNLWELCFILLRMIELTCVFIPLLMLYPFTRLGSNIKNFWYRVMLRDLEFCGPIFVKLGQWASTRRDLFPEELCTCLSKLQRRTRTHSWYYTQYCLEKAYGSQWKKIFISFDNDCIPVGSGCCAQVYKAWIDPEALAEADVCYDESKDSLLVEGLEMFGLGKFLNFKNHNQHNSVKEFQNCKGELIPVAIKVRHPRMEIMLRRDLAILKTMASAVTSLFPSLKWLSLVDCVEDFAQLMKAQVDLCVEGHNLDKFSANFKGMDSVKFPCPIWPLTRTNILVETYEEGQPMQNFVMDKSGASINVKLAELGINTILKMVFEDNFAHGDLHPGNMLVQEKDEKELNVKKSNSIFPFSFAKKQSFPVNLVILDCGITASLDERGKKCLKGVFAAVADGDGEKAAELFLNHSSHQCSDPEKFKGRMKEIVDTALDKSVTLEQVEVASLLSSLFSTMIEHKVKLDGSFSSIILAIMVLEGLGRSLDPTIDVVEKAKPFLLSSM